MIPRMFAAKWRRGGRQMLCPTCNASLKPSTGCSHYDFILKSKFQMAVPTSRTTWTALRFPMVIYHPFLRVTALTHLTVETTESALALRFHHLITVWLAFLLWIFIWFTFQHAHQLICNRIDMSAFSWVVTARTCMNRLCNPWPNTESPFCSVHLIGDLDQRHLMQWRISSSDKSCMLRVMTEAE